MRTLVMGVLNVTPDSFYDGGRYFDAVAAIARGREMFAEGADLVDIGGESSRPGARPVDPEQERARVVPVVEALAAEGRVSIDTRHELVARAAIAAGATLVNDISSTLAPVAADHGVGLVVMHMQGTPQDMQRAPHYDDLIGEVHGELFRSGAAARALGIDELYLDPGIGFGKRFDDNLVLLGSLGQLVASGEKILVGTSRKAFLGALGARADGRALEPNERFEGSLATAVWAMSCGVAMVRVHDVRATADAARLLADEHLLAGERATVAAR